MELLLIGLRGGLRLRYLIGLRLRLRRQRVRLVRHTGRLLSLRRGWLGEAVTAGLWLRSRTPCCGKP